MIATAARFSPAAEDLLDNYKGLVCLAKMFPSIPAWSFGPALVVGFIGYSIDLGVKWLWRGRKASPRKILTNP
jgi:hypothetical protein